MKMQTATGTSNDRMGTKVIPRNVLFPGNYVVES
jgi:hypothetical protein